MKFSGKEIESSSQSDEFSVQISSYASNIDLTLGQRQMTCRAYNCWFRISGLFAISDGTRKDPKLDTEMLV